MKKYLVRCLFFIICIGAFANVADAQKKRTATKRSTTRKTTKSKTKTKVSPTAAVDSVATPAPAAAAPAPVNDSLPIKQVLKSLRRDASVDDDAIRDRTPLPYDHIRADDAVYRQRLWREIDAREKMNLPFRYAADENNGNQRFISILLQAIQDSVVTVFSSVDDRFTTPMTKADVAKAIGGEPIPVKQYDSLGNEIGVVMKAREINWDSIYKFHIKEEVVFDKETSTLVWRILGIAPVMNVISSQGINLGQTELFWVYYPDMRPVFAKYDTYNGKNYGARMSWEELFENRMFSGRIYKSSMDNPYDQDLKNMPGLKDNTLFQLLEGENIKDKIFNYEQDLWQY
ncbi:type IX secretion system ring subunit PorN/GldN [Ferruginibacter albus]|uniref:type IX secretion system ring protein PorN/GldN n=1 Tax=Ferruginibacter albus TaxID=2875540 RepID=UPI001CC648D4|nr:gliding motility protein GldN [Ferruginibacter albus]UAY51702.1 gliding motility protein GldN [Ferruginibacter albus]